MTSFARYYKDRQLFDVSMEELEELIKDEQNKAKVAELIYQRYFNRYLKLFTYKSSQPSETCYWEGGKVIGQKNEFDFEYKSGFIIMTSCCLLIETIAAFFKGLDQTPKNGGGIEAFKSVFAKAEQYKNRLSEFKDEPIYKNIRNGLLHQGETYGKFLIRRSGKLFDASNKAINATLFARHLDEFLQSYRDELKNSKWDSALWDKCRVKLRYIIENSKPVSGQ